MTSLLNSTTAITDLKEAQGQQNKIVVFKNHEKKYQKILPIQQLTTYKAGQVLEFSFKGQGVDYINFNGSTLMIQVTMSTVNQELPFGTEGFIQRFQFRSGTYDFQDIFGYGRWLYSEIRGAMKWGYTDELSKNYSTQAGHPVGGICWLRIPIVTCLDSAGYFPIYNLAEDLRIRLTLAPDLECCSCLSDHAGVRVGSYTINNAYFLVDGLTGISGSNLDDLPYKFHSINVIGFRDSIPNYDAWGINTLHKISYDIKKTSLKSCYCCIRVNPTWVTPANQTNVQNLDTFNQTLGGGATGNIDSYTYTLGGIQFPFQNGVENDHQAYIQYEKHFHRQDSSPLTTAFQNTYANFVLLPANPGTTSDYAMYGDFDRLDQVSEIISGIDSERFPIQLSWTSLSNGLVAFTCIQECWFTYDIVVTLVGGEIKIED
jgi:hypothetical protein